MSLLASYENDTVDMAPDRVGLCGISAPTPSARAERRSSARVRGESVRELLRCSASKELPLRAAQMSPGVRATRLEGVLCGHRRFCLSAGQR
jgi:hypothetical protein